MGILTNVVGGILGEGVSKPIEALGTVFDKLFTSDEEKAQAAFVLERLRQEPQMMQLVVNQAEAGHRTVFVAGWRPFVGWVCGFALAYQFMIRDLFAWGLRLWRPGIEAPPVMDLDQLIVILLGMLGLAGYRTIEKSRGVTQ